MTTSREARRGLGPAWTAIALGALVAVALAVTSRFEADVVPPPLELTEIRALAGEQGAVLVRVVVRNVGERHVELRGVAVPQIASARSGTGSNTRGVPIAPSGSGQFLLRLPARCPDGPEFDHLQVLLHVEGREIEQTLRVRGPLDLGCP